MCFGARPAEELYDLTQDPFELMNLAERPEFRATKEELSARLMNYLAERGDPRARQRRRVRPLHHPAKVPNVGIEQDTRDPSAAIRASG